MKILVGHNYYKQPGGEDQCVLAEIALLESFGHEVIPYRVHNDTIDSMSRWRVACKTIWNRSSHRELQSLIRTERPDVAHFHNTFPLISPAAYDAAHAEGVPVVQTLHNFRLLCPNALFFREGRICEDCLGKSVPWPGVVHKCYRGSLSASTTVATMLTVHRARGTWQKRVDQYIALTEFSRSKLIEGGLPGELIAVKPNFVYPDPGVGRGTGRYAIFVGRLSEEKGLGVLLDAWKELEVPLKIVGDGPLAAKLSEASPAVQWLGRKPMDEVYELIGAASLLVLPSQCYENFPRVIAEAFAKGTPVLASRLGAMAELIDDGLTGFHFNPGEAADLAATVHKFWSLASDEVDKMRRAARQQFEEKYTADANHRTLLSLYESAISRRVPMTEGAAVGGRV